MARTFLLIATSLRSLLSLRSLRSLSLFCLLGLFGLLDTLYSVCLFVFFYRENKQTNKHVTYSCFRSAQTDERFLYPNASAICWRVMPSSLRARASSALSSDRWDLRDKRGEVREVRECHLKLPKFSKFPKTKIGADRYLSSRATSSSARRWSMTILSMMVFTTISISELSE